MTLYVFAGPTISVSAVCEQLDAICRPPAAGGDIYRAARTNPTAIALIDGQLEQVPSVWHKEILWAMTQGIHVYGAAAMGALRAAELAAFGMEGVGSIYEAYRDRRLQDDDEVIVTYAGEAEQYRPLSDAMVNIRATLAAAARVSVISPATLPTLEAIAKELFYPNRRYDEVLERAAGRGVDAGEIGRLRDWLPANRIEQTRVDAMALLAYVRERLASGLPPKQVIYRLERTEYWERICQTAYAERDPAPPA